MLGRMAGYQKREVTWEELLAHGETYELGDAAEDCIVQAVCFIVFEKATSLQNNG
jgi:hypothetical protein